MESEDQQLPEATRELDARIHEMFRGSVLRVRSGMFAGGMPVPAYTTSIDAIVSLCKEELPGWVWRLCECHVTDDAWLMPDMNHPDHAAEFADRFPNVIHPLEDGPGLDMSFGPAGRPALALAAVFLSVIRGLRENAQPREDAHDIRQVAAGTGLYPEMAQEILALEKPEEEFSP